jgi:hypothetical protein
MALATLPTSSPHDITGCGFTAAPISFHTMKNQDHHDSEPFGPVIYSYTRAQAVADGVQVEVTKTANEAGRLWDIVWMLRFAILRSRPGADRIPVALYVRNDNRRATLIKLVATCGPLDIDDPQPAITVMMPDED